MKNVLFNVPDQKTAIKGETNKEVILKGQQMSPSMTGAVQFHCIQTW